MGQRDRLDFYGVDDATISRLQVINKLPKTLIDISKSVNRLIGVVANLVKFS